MNLTLTALPGLRAGHATSDDGTTGCTVVLGPLRAAVDVRGLATGTRELDVLSPLHLVPHVDAIVLTGGSAPGLAAADGVSDWLRERGRGFQVGNTHIPIVPAAVIFDVADEAPGRHAADADAAPNHAADADAARRHAADADGAGRHAAAAAPVSRHALGRAACDAAEAAAPGQPLAEGRVGAGAGATVGKIRGPQFASPGGVGCWAVRHGEFTVSALAVVNAFGDVVDERGRIVAGARDDAGGWLDSMQAAAAVDHTAPAAGANTTLCVIATDAPLTRTALQIVARAGSAAIVRRTAPASTIFDGDVVFAVTTSDSATDIAPAALLALCVSAQLATERAILRAVGAG